MCFNIKLYVTNKIDTGALYERSFQIIQLVAIHS